MPNKYTPLLVFILILFYSSIKAQVDTEFWFVAPSVIQQHGDAPIAFRITALDQPANITLTMPANPGFTRTLSLDAYEQDKIEFTNRSDINAIENSPGNNINSKGILITSDNNISVYYEVANGSNPDKFTLKGKNALGTEFFASSQTEYANKDNGYNPLPYEAINIVATEDGTVVEITPTANVVGHNAGTTYTISLDRGQTYSIEGNSIDKDYTLSGTYIKSNKDIAVTISDDSIRDEQGKSWDLIGDQTVPISITGTEYIAMFSGAPQANSWSLMPIEKVYILATTDNTTVTVDETDSSTGSFDLDKGERISLDILENSALHIKSTAPVYVYQLAGLVGSSNELGSAILPPIKCTGSSSVTFTKILNARFFVQILTQYKNIDDFTFVDDNGNTSNALNGLSWVKVPNTGPANGDDTWYFVNQRLDGFDTNKPHTLSNSKGLFHLSVFDENSGSASFGYFSAFNSLAINGPTEQCAGDVIKLRASESLGTYNWFSEKTKEQIISTDQVLEVTESGLYWVVASRMINSNEGCELTDSIEVEFNMPEFDLGEDTEICFNDTYVITPTINEGTFYWQDGSTGSSYTYTSNTNGTDEIWLQITDEDGCSATDTIKVTTKEEIPIDLNVEVTSQNFICAGNKIYNTTPLDAYEWRYGDKTSAIISTDPYVNVNQSGWYYLTATQDGCSAIDSIEITLSPLPTYNLNDEILCHDATYSSPANSNSSYEFEWTTINAGINSTNAQISFNQTDSVYVNITDNTTGCLTKDSALITFRAETTTTPKTITICGYTDVGLNADAVIIADYVWEYNNTTLSETGSTLNLVNVLKSQEGTYTVTGTDINGCSVSQTFTLNVTLGDPIDLGSDKNICEGETTTLNIGSTPASAFRWFDQDPETNTGLTPLATSATYAVNTSGTYYVMTTHSNGCYSVDHVNVTVNPLPNIDLPDITDECQGETETYDAGTGYSYLWHDGSTQQTYTAVAPEDISVTITDSNGCVNSDNTTYNWKSVNIFSSDTITACPATPYTITTNSGISNISWFFNDGSATTDLNNNNNAYTINSVSLADAGIYIVEADENGCSNVIDTINFYVVDVGSINLGPDKTICNGDVIQLNANDGFDTYQWTLQNGANSGIKSTTQSIEAGQYTDATLSAEDWEIYAVHSSGCSLTDNITVHKVAPPVISLTDHIEPCANEVVILNDLIDFNNTSSNSNHPFFFNQINYYWDGSTTSTTDPKTIQIDASGVYDLVISNTNVDFYDTSAPFHCYSTTEVNVSYHDEFVIPALFDQFICQGDATDLITPIEVKNYSELHSFQWVKLDAGGNISESNPTDQDWLNTNEPAAYALMVEYTNEACIATDTMSLITKANPNITISGDQEICQGDTTIFQASPSTYNSYLWSNGSTYDTTKVSTAGAYQLTVEGLNGCSTTETINLAVNELPNVSLNTNSLGLCDGTSDVISVTSVKYSDGSDVSNPSFLWNTWEQSSAVTVSTPGTFTVEATDGNGCKNTDDVEVIQYPKTTIDLSGINTLGCSNEGILLECPLTVGTDIQSFQWTKQGTSTGNPNPNTNWTVNESGTYILTIIDNNLCEESDSVDITIYQSPSVELGMDRNICVGETLSIPSPVNYTSYIWNTGSTDSSIQISSASNPVNYSVTVYDENGCFATDDININPIPLPVVTLPSAPITCPGTEIELMPQIANKPISYSVWWSTNSSKETIKVGAGTYHVTITDNQNGCSGSTTTEVRWHDAPKVTLGSDTLICPLIDVLAISPIEGDIYNNYLWHNNQTSYAINADIGSINTVNVTDANNCKTFDQQKIQYMQVVDTTYNFTLCQKDTTISLLDLDPEADNHTGQYLWLSDNSTSSFKSFFENDTSIVNIGISINNSLTTCYFKQDTVVMNFMPLPQIEVLDTTIYRQVVLKMDMANDPYQYSLDSIFWQNENTFSNLEAGEYTAYILDNNGCTNSQVFSISDAIDIDVPNFVTPNGDGYNDVWKIDGLEKLPEAAVRIYDRYGKLLVMYNGTYAAEYGWDGTYQNKPMPSTDYWYVIELLPTKKLLKGHFTLKR